MQPSHICSHPNHPTNAAIPNNAGILIIPSRIVPKCQDFPFACGGVEASFCGHGSPGAEGQVCRGAKASLGAGAVQHAFADAPQEKPVVSSVWASHRGGAAARAHCGDAVQTSMPFGRWRIADVAWPKEMPEQDWQASESIFSRKQSMTAAPCDESFRGSRMPTLQCRYQVFTRQRILWGTLQRCMGVTRGRAQIMQSRCIGGAGHGRTYVYRAQGLPREVGCTGPARLKEKKTDRCRGAAALPPSASVVVLPLR